MMQAETKNDVVPFGFLLPLQDMEQLSMSKRGNLYRKLVSTPPPPPAIHPSSCPLPSTRLHSSSPHIHLSPHSRCPDLT